MRYPITRSRPLLNLPGDEVQSQQSSQFRDKVGISWWTTMCFCDGSFLFPPYLLLLLSWEFFILENFMWKRGAAHSKVESANCTRIPTARRAPLIHSIFFQLLPLITNISSFKHQHNLQSVTLTVNIYRNILTIKGSKLGSSLFYCAASIGDLAQPIKVQNVKWFKFQGERPFSPSRWTGGEDSRLQEEVAVTAAGCPRRCAPPVCSLRNNNRGMKQCQCKLAKGKCDGTH